MRNLITFSFLTLIAFFTLAFTSNAEARNHCHHCHKHKSTRVQVGVGLNSWERNTYIAQPTYVAPVVQPVYVAPGYYSPAVVYPAPVYVQQPTYIVSRPAPVSGLSFSWNFFKR